jgi:hypothetical protein
MEKLMTKQNLMFAGIGLLTAVIVYKVLVAYDKPSVSKNSTTKPATASVDEKSSDFCGCGA